MYNEYRVLNDVTFMPDTTVADGMSYTGIKEPLPSWLHPLNKQIFDNYTASGRNVDGGGHIKISVTEGENGRPILTWTATNVAGQREEIAVWDGKLVETHKKEDE